MSIDKIISERIEDVIHILKHRAELKHLFYLQGNFRSITDLDTRTKYFIREVGYGNKAFKQEATKIYNEFYGAYLNNQKFT